MQIAICDDNPRERSYYVAQITKLATENEIPVQVEQYDSGDALLFAQEEPGHVPDLILLDIGMPGADGIETARRLRGAPYHSKAEILFVTVRGERAVDAFDVQAYHFIVKNATEPVRQQEIILSAMQKAKAHMQEYILLRGVGEYRNILVDSIQYFEVVQRIITVHYGKGETFEFYSTISKLELMMLPLGFLRVHRSFIVNSTKMIAMQDGMLYLKNDMSVPIGRKFQANVRAILNSRKNK